MTVIQEIAQNLIDKLNAEVATHKANALKTEGAILGINLLYTEIAKSEQEAEKAEKVEEGEEAVAK